MYHLIVGQLDFPLSTDKQTITAQAGDTVTLPCQAYSSVNITTVKWTTPKLEESSKEEYVWLLRDGHIPTQNQHPDFTDRVEAADIQLNNGNLSISLKNVTRNDTETFICQYIDSDAKKGNCTVLLNVTESGENSLSSIIISYHILLSYS